MIVNEIKFDHLKYFLDTFSDNAEMPRVESTFCA